jgi:hypothetical protein
MLAREAQSQLLETPDPVLDECVNFLEHLSAMLMNEFDQDADESDKYKIL